MPDPSPGESPVQSHYDWSKTVPSLVVVDALAAFENETVADLPPALETTLYDCVEDTLVTESDDITVSLTTAAYRAQIDGNELTIHAD